MCEFHFSDEELILTEEQENRILAIAMAVNNDLEKGTFYRYDGPAAQRNFCKVLMALNKLYTKDDINRMSFQGLNSQFAKRGTNKYSIFKYRGGANCKHFWREVEVRIDENGLPYEIDKGIVDDSKVERLNFSELINEVKNKTMNYYELVFEGEDDEIGVNGVSLVSRAAIGIEAIQFAEEDAKPIEIKMADEDKRILISPVLIPNQKIYRNFSGEECYVHVTEETISRLQQNFFKNNFNKNSKLEHDSKIEGVYFFESWIIDNPEMDKAKAIGYDLPKGTWMMAMKVENQDIWDNYVKTGIVTGFSIDGLMKLKPVTKDIQMNKIEVLFKNALKQAIIEMEKEKQITIMVSDTLSYYSDTPLEMGVIVYDELGEIVKNVEFTFEGKVYKTGDLGEITSIEDVVVDEIKTDELPVEEIKMESETLGKFEGDNGEVVYAEWLTLGKTLFNEAQETLPNYTFEHEGRIYSTNDIAEIVKIEKNESSPFWKIELADEVVAEVATEIPAVLTDEEKDAKIAELEALLIDKDAEISELKSKLEEAEVKLTKLEADLVLQKNEVITMSKQTPASLGIVDRPSEDKSATKSSSALDAIRKALK